MPDFSDADAEMEIHLIDEDGKDLFSGAEIGNVKISNII